MTAEATSTVTSSYLPTSLAALHSHRAAADAQKLKQEQASSSTSYAALYAKAPSKWVCKRCTLQNEATAGSCEACEEPRPKEVLGFTKVDEGAQVTRNPRPARFVSKLETIFEGKPVTSGWSTGSCVVGESDDGSFDEFCHDTEEGASRDASQKASLLAKYGAGRSMQANSQSPLTRYLSSEKGTGRQEAICEEGGSLTDCPNALDTAEVVGSAKLPGSCLDQLIDEPSAQISKCTSLTLGCVDQNSSEYDTKPYGHQEKIVDDESSSDEECEIEFKEVLTNPGMVRGSVANDESSSEDECDAELKEVIEVKDDADCKDVSSVEDECENRFNEVDDEESSIEDECDVEFREVTTGP